MKYVFIAALLGVFTLFVYQGGERKTLGKFEKSAERMWDASKDAGREAGNVVRDSSEAVGVPKAKKWFEEHKKKAEKRAGTENL